MNFGEWVEKRRKQLGLDRQMDLAVRSGLSISVIQRVESMGTLEGRSRSTRKLLADALQVPLKELEDRAAGTWTGGESPGGKMFRTDTGAYSRGRPSHMTHPHGVALPVINSVSAGAPAQFTDLGYAAGVAENYIIIPREARPDQDTFFLRVHGDSMIPLFQPGDYVALDPNATFTPGAVYCIQCNGHADDENCLAVVIELDAENYELRKINPRYPSRRVRKDAVTRLSRFVYRIESQEAALRRLFG